MEQPRITKKSRIIDMYDKGFDVESIADAVSTSPSYVANTLIESGRPVDYEDLYTTTTGRRYSAESRRLSGLLRFKTVEAAQESVRDLDEAFEEYARSGNRRGQHRVQMLALTGKNRAESIGKRDEAQVFRDWLVKTLSRETEEEAGRERAA